ncbi:hypothetical protein Z948_2391 [Sulfitobacter donghicola DSW-25 = KCTC 12864 = JCM 14565]|nr:hypothetical protein Z948_2391 [Sulfitobacter donghicola DSW-25 = KCTC 12864 = JCM 14565]
MKLVALLSAHSSHSVRYDQRQLWRIADIYADRAPCLVLASAWVKWQVGVVCAP